MRKCADAASRRPAAQPRPDAYAPILTGVNGRAAQRSAGLITFNGALPRGAALEAGIDACLHSSLRGQVA